MREIPLTKARTVLGRLAREEGLSRGEVVAVTRRGKAALVVQRADDFARFRSGGSTPAGRLRGSLTILGDLEAASKAINARLRRRVRTGRAG